MRLSTAIHYLRARPFDLSTEAGRSAERYRLAAISVLANVLGRGVSMITMVLGVSWTLPYLGTERFGVWMTIASFAGMLTFLDLGIGNTLTNRIASISREDKTTELRDAIGGGLGTLAIIAVFVGAILYTVALVLPWESLIKVHQTGALEEAKHTARIFTILFAVSIFTTGIQKIFAGLQRSFEAHLSGTLGSLLSLCGLWVATHYHAGPPQLLLVTFGFQLLSSTLLLALIIKRGQLAFHVIPRATVAEAPKLLHTGSLFFVLQIGTMIGWGADQLIISSTLGAAQVAIYSVVQRLFQFVGQPLAMFNAPLWAAYANAVAEQDKRFIRRTLKRSMTITFVISSIGVALLIVVGPRLVSIWTKNSLTVPFLVYMVYGIWVIFDSCGNALAMFMNGNGVVRPQVVTVVILSAIAVPAKLIGCSYGGIVGLVGSYIASYALIVGVAYGVIFRKTIFGGI